MIKLVYKLYNASHLAGERLVQPLKTYNCYFAKKIHESKNLQTIAWRVAQIMLGIVVYPLLGTWTGLGLLIKHHEFKSLEINNEREKTLIKFFKLQLKEVDDSDKSINYDHNPRCRSGWELRVIYELKMNKSNLDQNVNEITQAIDSFTSEFRKVYCKGFGVINREGIGEITIQLSKIQKA